MKKNRCALHVLYLGTFVLTIVGFLGCEKTAPTVTTDCRGDDCKRALLLAMEDLSKIEIDKGRELTEAETQKIKDIVSRFRTPQTISALALLSRSMLRSCGEATCSKESKLEAAYENAFWYSVETLAKNKEPNKEVLDGLKYHAVLNDTESGDWGRIINGKEFP